MGICKCRRPLKKKRAKLDGFAAAAAVAVAAAAAAAAAVVTDWLLCSAH
jgi:hypothetical protein